MKRKRGTKSKNGGVPKRGDPDYLTPTQLRNRRKRRAKQQQQQRGGIDVVDGGTSSSNGNDVDVVSGRRGGGLSDGGKRKGKVEGKGMGMGTNTIDPSMAYIANPTNAPIVDAARRYLEPILRLHRDKDRIDNDDDDDDDDRFRVHLGPVSGWRTVSKLAVRPAEPHSSSSSNVVTCASDKSRGEEKPRVAIGMFLPKSHKLLPVPNCMAHHPSINVAVNCIEMACHEIGVLPYVEGGHEDGGSTEVDGIDDGCIGDDASIASMGGGMIGEEGGVGGSSVDGRGRLRYVSINVARDTGGAQITLVWNSPPPPPPTTTTTSSRPRPIPTDDGMTERKSDARTAGIIDPDLSKLVARLISMSSTSISSSDVVVAAGDEPDGRGDPSTRKRRRRGRQEGLRSAMRDDGASSSDAIAARKGRVDVVGVDGDDDRVGGCGGGGGGGSSRLRSKSSDAGGRLNLHSIWINYNRSCRHSNAIFAYDPDCWRHVHGPRAITEYLAFGASCDVEDEAPGSGRGLPPPQRRLPRTLANPRPAPFPIPLHFPPNVFRQANLDAFAGIVGRIRDRIARDIIGKNDDVSCVELYGGVGTIGLHLSDIVSSLICSDENPNNERSFNDSLLALPGHIRSRLAYRRKNAADMIKTELPLIRKCRVLIVDPPRKGLDIEVVDYLCQEGWRDHIELVAYVSCGFRAFQRDCDALMRSGRWKVAFAEGYLLFPGSDAIETLAFFVPS